MPTKAKAKTKKDRKVLKAKTAKPGRNGFDPKTAQRYVDQYEALDGKIERIHKQAAKDAQPFRDEQKDIIKRAAEDGIPKGAMRAALRKRRLQERAEAVGAGLTEEQLGDFEQLQHALGMLADTPLGAAATKKAKTPKPKADEAPTLSEEPETADETQTPHPEDETRVY